MKYKKLITLLAGITIGVAGLTTVATNTSQTVQASKASDIDYYGFWTKYPTRSFRKWKKVILTDKTKFTLVPSSSMPQEMQKGIYYGDIKPKEETKVLPEGTIIYLREGKHDFWDVKSSKLPKTKYYDWEFAYTKYYDQVYYFSFATLNSYVGVSTLFRTPRKVQVTKNVRAYQLHLTSPMANCYSTGHKTIKKGTVLKVGAPTNHWNHQIWGKGIKNTSKYIWTIQDLSGWYKFLD